MILEISYLIPVDSLAASYRGYYWGYLSDDIFGSDKELKELQFVSVFCSALVSVRLYLLLKLSAS